MLLDMGLEAHRNDCGELPEGHKMGELAARWWPGVERPESGGVSHPGLKQTADSDLPRGRERSPRPKDRARAGSMDRRSTFEKDLHTYGYLVSGLGGEPYLHVGTWSYCVSTCCAQMQPYR
jgi:hypothetical protein